MVGVILGSNDDDDDDDGPELLHEMPLILFWPSIFRSQPEYTFIFLANDACLAFKEFSEARYPF